MRRAGSGRRFSQTRAMLDRTFSRPKGTRWPHRNGKPCWRAVTQFRSPRDCRQPSTGPPRADSRKIQQTITNLLNQSIFVSVQGGLRPQNTRKAKQKRDFWALSKVDASEARHERRRVCGAGEKPIIGPKTGTVPSEARHERRRDCPCFWAFREIDIPTLRTLPPAFGHNRTFSPAPLSLFLRTTSLLKTGPAQFSALRIARKMRV